MNKTNDSVKFAIIEMKESFGSLNVGSRHKALVYKDVCVIIDGLIGFSYPLAFQGNQFKVIEFI